MFPWESPRKTLHVIKCHSGRSRAHLMVSTERVFEQTRAVCANRFHLLLWASIAARMIKSSRSTNIIATLSASLITSFRPLAEINYQERTAAIWPLTLGNRASKAKGLRRELSSTLFADQNASTGDSDYPLSADPSPCMMQKAIRAGASLVPRHLSPRPYRKGLGTKLRWSWLGLAC